IYGAAWDGEPAELFSTRSGFPESRSLGFRNTHLHCVSSSGELAVSLDSRFTSHRQFVGTLARVPLEGAVPRPVLENVSEADWSGDGRLAVVRMIDGRSRLEFPVGTVRYETTGWISHPRIAPKGNSIAFLEHPFLGDDRGSVAVVDLAGGARRTLSDGWAGEQGLGWSTPTNEVWFTAAESGFARALHAVTPAGKTRLVTRMAGGLILSDLAADGRMLVIRDVESSEIKGRFAGESK